MTRGYVLDRIISKILQYKITNNKSKYEVTLQYEKIKIYDNNWTVSKTQ